MLRLLAISYPRKKMKEGNRMKVGCFSLNDADVIHGELESQFM